MCLFNVFALRCIYIVFLDFIWTVVYLHCLFNVIADRPVVGLGRRLWIPVRDPGIGTPHCSTHICQIYFLFIAAAKNIETLALFRGVKKRIYLLFKMASVQIWVDNLLRCKERDQLLKSFLWFSVHQKNLHVMAPSGPTLDQRGNR